MIQTNDELTTVINRINELAKEGVESAEMKLLVELVEEYELTHI